MLMLLLGVVLLEHLDLVLGDGEDGARVAVGVAAAVGGRALAAAAVRGGAGDGAAAAAAAAVGGRRRVGPAQDLLQLLEVVELNRPHDRDQLRPFLK